MSVGYNPKIVTDGLVLCLDAGNKKCYDPLENILTYSEADTSNWTELTSNTTESNLDLNALGLFKGVLVTSTTGAQWHRHGTGYVFSLTSGNTYTLTYFYRAGTTGAARLQVRINSVESFVQGPADGSNWTIQNSAGTVSNVTTTLMEDGLTYRTTYTLASSQTGTCSLAIGIGTDTVGGTVIALGAQVENGSYYMGYVETTGTSKLKQNTYLDLSRNKYNGDATSVKPYPDTTAGTVLDHNTSSIITHTFSTPVNHESWSLVYFVRSTGLTSSNYRGVIQLREDNASHGYFYNIDTRETTNSYILGYQKDFNINSWLTYGYMSAAQWDDQGWWCLGVSYYNGVFRHYTNGIFVNTQTQTRDVAGYGDLTSMRINYSGSNTVLLGPVLFYEGILTDAQFEQNFNALRGRFGI